MIGLALVLVASGFFDRVQKHDLIHLGSFVIEGVAITSLVGSGPEYLQTCTRVTGTLPMEGIWSLKVISVTDPSTGNGIKSNRTGTYTDITTSNRGALTQLVKASDFDSTATVVGELVHYQSVKEEATFPTIQLETTDGNRKQKPAFRNWSVPEKDHSTARTPLGLELRFTRLNGYGYSGPGYDDLSRLPVKVLESTMNKGVESLLKKYNEKAVDRVDASVPGLEAVAIFQKSPPTEYGVFSFEDKEFKREVQLSLSVTRQIVDKRFKFKLTMPIQKDVDLFEEVRGDGVKRRIVKWPSSATP